MKRIPTMSINNNMLTMSKIIPEKLGDTLSFGVDKENKQIIVSKVPGDHMALVTYPAATPVIHSASLFLWIKQELGERNYSKMEINWVEDRFTVQTGEKGAGQ